MQAQDVAFGVAQPGGALRAEHADVLHRLETRQVVVVEDHAALLQPGDRRRDVGDLEADRGVLGLRAFGFGNSASSVPPQW